MTHEYTVLHGGLVITLDGAAPTDGLSRAAGAADAAGIRASAIAFASIGVSMMPGETAQTRTPSGPWSWASVRTTLMSPALAAA